MLVLRCEAEIGQLNGDFATLLILSEEQIVRLQIPMHDLHPVHVVESLEDLLDNVDDLLFSELSLILQLCGKVSLNDQFHHDVVIEGIFDQLAHLDDILMLSLGYDGQLILAQLLHVLVSRQTALFDHFDGACLPCFSVLRLHH